MRAVRREALSYWYCARGLLCQVWGNAAKSGDPASDPGSRPAAFSGGLGRIRRVLTTSGYSLATPRHRLITPQSQQFHPGPGLSGCALGDFHPSRMIIRWFAAQVSKPRGGQVPPDFHLTRPIINWRAQQALPLSKSCAGISTRSSKGRLSPLIVTTAALMSRSSLR